MAKVQFSMAMMGVLQVVYDQYESTIELLNNYYDKNIIYPKYRDLVALCMIYEYLVSGRCLTLEGRNGAYNKYDIC